MVLFCWFNIISFHHVVWVTFINGPIFLILSYFEFIAEAQIEYQNTGIFDEAYVKVRMNRAIILYVILCMSQYLQQLEFSIIFVKQRMIVRQQAQLHNLFMSQRDGIIVYSLKQPLANSESPTPAPNMTIEMFNPSVETLIEVDLKKFDSKKEFKDMFSASLNDSEEDGTLDLDRLCFNI